MKRGEVRWVDFDLPDKRRPGIILTRDSAIGYLNAVTIAPITTTIRETPSQVRLNQEDGLQVECAVNLHNLQTVTKTQVGGLIAVINERKMDTIESALLFALGMDRRLRHA
jgi:mRNA interferase MazF